MGDEDAELDQQSGGAGHWLLLSALVVLALVATGVLIFTGNPRWLRLGVLAALWAALLGALLAARYRKQVAERDVEVASLRAWYEQELREQQSRGEPAGEIAELREELRVVRENLDAVMGGEALVEHIALQAAFTRSRPPRADAGRPAPTAGHRRPVAPGRLPGGGPEPAPRWPGRDTATAIRPASPLPGTVARTPSSGSLRPVPTGYPSRPDERAAIARNGYRWADEPADSSGHAARNGHPVPLPERRSQHTEASGPAAQAQPPARSAAEPTGAHAAGTSVTELLAAHGAPSARRRRRRDD